ncbi:MAG: dephospho-CoA kinase [Candidatus Hydrogenedentes bacterium]|nr:dephospho-CoA kinase [Candidatus Hydrogenedentota bacterium]
MRVIGLTGGIGSGKSEAGRRFCENGVPTVSADEVAHTLLEPGGAAVDAVVDAFGEEIMANGRVDRARLAAKVFGNPEAVARLNGITHPLIGIEIARHCAAFAGQGHTAALVDAALLGENGRREPFLQGLILVLCPDDERMRRLVELRGIPHDEALRRMRAQTPPERKIPLADWVIRNDGSIEHLHRQVDAVAREIKEAGR